MKGVKTQKVGESGRYFHMTKRYPILMSVNLLFSVLIGVLAQFWLLGVIFFAFVGLIIISHYFFWNNMMNSLLRSGGNTEEEARAMISAAEKGGGAAESDPFLDADNCGMSGNIFHND
jgi:hypothetical protein